MSDWAIRASGVSKQFMLGAADPRHQTLREAITATICSPLARFRRLSSRDNSTSYWALEDVGFELEAGGVLGLIGRNGAGKSTLLKVLGRITAPTQGRIEMRGRVASLLEVGTGFHPELTGRENIYLNGAILGMSRGEISRKFDQIVAFAGVEQFLDTPVKRYSSGMYVRLAFAVASNIEPEILLIDEVLAVGDLEFQKKCLDRMRSMARGSSTIVFVSHNMAAIQALCDRCLLLDHGRAVALGSSSQIVAQYIANRSERSFFQRSCDAPDRPSVERADVEVLSADPQSPTWRLRIHLVVSSPSATSVAIGLRIRDGISAPVAFASRGHFGPHEMVALKAGSNSITLELPIDHFALGEYTITIRMSVPFVAVIEELDDCLTFVVARAPRPGASLALPQSWGYGGIELPLAIV